jgi:hypothetical protein
MGRLDGGCGLGCGRRRTGFRKKKDHSTCIHALVLRGITLTVAERADLPIIGLRYEFQWTLSQEISHAVRDRFSRRRMNPTEAPPPSVGA